MAHSLEVRVPVEEAIKLLRAEARMLLKWARESQDGGWSTHQVGPMRRRAMFLKMKARELALLKNRG